LCENHSAKGLALCKSGLDHKLLFPLLGEIRRGAIVHVYTFL